MRGDHAYFAGLLDIKGRLQGQGPTIGIAVQSPRFEVVDYISRAAGVAIVEKPSTSFNRRPCTDHCPTAHQHVITGMSYQATVTGLRAAIVIEACHLYLLRWPEFQARLNSYTTWYNHFDHTPQAFAQQSKIVDDLAMREWHVPSTYLARIAAAS